MNVQGQPLVSIILVTWNSAQYLSSCLEKVKAQAYTHYEVVVVDNGSIDASVVHANEFFPNVTIIRNEANLGFAAANNLGIAASHGEFILCLNTDVFITREFLLQLVKELAENPSAGSTCGKLLRATTHERPIIDSTGLSMTRSLLSRDRGTEEEERGQYDTQKSVFAPCAAAALYRKTALDDVQLDGCQYFDSDFFAYYEDTDLGWRLRSRGWLCVYVPEAVAYHVRGGAVGQHYSFFNKSDSFKLHTIKNRYLMLTKNLVWKEVQILWLHLILMDAVIWGYCVLHPRLGIRLVKQMSLLLPRALRLRRATQLRRVVGFNVVEYLL